MLMSTMPPKTKPKISQTSIDEVLNNHFKILKKPKVPCDGTVVKIDKMFGGRRPYWRDFVRSDRFAVSERNGILYRERIVDQLIAKVDEAISLGVVSGVIVKGPQGVGKSHSLVNLVLKLQASGNYLVTFVPDCDW
jgi:hypothetical protein